VRAALAGLCVLQLALDDHFTRGDILGLLPPELLNVPGSGTQEWQYGADERQAITDIMAAGCCQDRWIVETKSIPVITIPFLNIETFLCKPSSQSQSCVQCLNAKDGKL